MVEEDSRLTTIPWLFVYGTLRRDNSHHHLLSPFSIEFVGVGMVYGETRIIDAYRHLFLNRCQVAGPVVWGEIYRLPPQLEARSALWAALDAWEEYDPRSPDQGPYRCEPIRVRLWDPESWITAWAYVTNYRRARPSIK
ncbi:hypothetical protein TPY_2867 [Sulfobacillus acidophilus TPY]|uniref:AIG2 family protein n=1 Tax=Sulfobacillus acidophilus (strain ATCC 700253 / DSM 10332 / NAL) TaxID=679936 RepID=G8TTE0_SULAD|nr:hypothetical protein TPY_2867 [Sulfobacillus acidophilus TPY]AEW04520.1 AIG2 family protein [Sulfobacillus acidophilus DSM 10332]